MKILPNLNSETYFKDNKIVLYDIGARGGLQSKWNTFSDCLSVYAFEPDEKEEMSNYNKLDDLTEINRLVSDEVKNVDFNVFRDEGSSSIYHNDKKYLDDYCPESKNDLEVLKTVSLPCTTIDKVVLNGGSIPDFMKIDVEGAAYEVCKGATNSLSQIIGIEAEVEFSNRYTNSKRFSELEMLLRDYKLDFYTIKSRYGKLSKGKKYGLGRGRILYSDVLFLKSPSSIIEFIDVYNEKKSKVNYILRAIFIYIQYGYLDLVYELIILSEGIITNEIKEDILKQLNNDYSSRINIPNFKGRSRLTYIFYRLYKFFEYNDEYSVNHYVGVDKHNLGNFYWDSIKRLD